MLKIYGVPISVHTRKVIVAAIEKDLAFENDPVIPFDAPAGWAELSPPARFRWRATATWWCAIHP